MVYMPVPEPAFPFWTIDRSGEGSALYQKRKGTSPGSSLFFLKRGIDCQTAFRQQNVYRPFYKKDLFSPLLHMAPIYFLSELKGISEIRRHCLRRSPGSFPASSAICKRACSKGSSFSPISSPEALFARMTDRRKEKDPGGGNIFLTALYP